MLVDEFVLDRLNLLPNQIILRLNLAQFILNSAILLLRIALSLFDFRRFFTHLFFHFGNTVNFVFENLVKVSPVEVAQVVFGELVCKVFELFH